MISTARITLFAAITLISGCVAEPAAPPPGTPALEIEPVAGGLTGTLRLPDEQLALSGSSAGGLLRLEISGEGGASYARIERDLVANTTSGWIGDQHFGGPDDARTDLDLALWRVISSSHTGEVLRAVSAAAAPLAVEGEPLAERDLLVTLSKLAPMLASMAFEDAEPARPTVLGVCSGNSLRVSVTGGTAYLATNNCDGTRTGTVVNECSGSTVYWRVRSYSTGSTINSGTKGNCVGGGVGTFYQKIRLEVLNAYGYWEGLVSY